MCESPPRSTFLDKGGTTHVTLVLQANFKQAEGAYAYVRLIKTKPDVRIWAGTKTLSGQTALLKKFVSRKIIKQYFSTTTPPNPSPSNMT